MKSKLNYFILLMIIPIITLTVITLPFFKECTLEYLYYTITLNVLFLIGFRKKSMFYETFLGTFLWLGYWLKTSIRVSFFQSTFYSPVGNFDFSGQQWSSVLMTVSTAALALITFSLVRQFFFSYQVELRNRKNSNLDVYYINNRKKVLGSFLLIIAIVCFTNTYLGVYQRGELTKTVLPFGINNIFKFLFLYGFTAISTIFLEIEIRNRKNVSLLLFSIVNLESFFSSLSILSRGMILNISALSWGIIKPMQLRFYKLSIKRIILFSIITLTLFTLSLSLVSVMRQKVYIDNPAHRDISVSTTASNTGSLILGRWIGTESILAVQGYNKKGFQLLNKAFKEKFNNEKMSFFDSTFIKSPYANTDFKKHHFITLPGIISFLAYSDSLTFMFFSCLLISFIGFVLELLAFKASKGNLALCSLVGYFISFRLTHFGYAPMRSYLFIIAMLGIICIPVLLNFILDFKILSRRKTLQKT